jgi:hypothetical protein
LGKIKQAKESHFEKITMNGEKREGKIGTGNFELLFEIISFIRNRKLKISGRSRYPAWLCPSDQILIFTDQPTPPKDCSK